MGNMKIVTGKGCYSSFHNIDTTSYCIGNCTYCYGFLHNKNPNVKVKTCNTKSLDRQWYKLQSSHNIIRVGKFTDPGYEQTEFRKLIDWMQSNNIRPVVVTKMPTTQNICIDKITKLNGVYQVTIGYDHLEPGMMDCGYTNLFRVEIAGRHIAAGYNVVFRLVREVTEPAGSWTRKFIDDFRDRILLTPLRFHKKDLISKVSANINNYTHHKGFYRANYIHNDYNNLATCFDNGKSSMCGMCLLK